jgi:cytochrome c-type biogenesis protein CcmE
VTTAPPVAPGVADGIPDAGPPPQGPPPARGRHRYRARYVVVGLILVGALVFLLVEGVGSALDFYLPANQAVAQRASLGDKTFNLEGVVEPGSIRSTSSGVDFVVTSGSTRLAVSNTGSPPQLFQPNIPVIAVGHFHGAGFVSDQILVKHSATYIAQYPSRVTAPNGTKR